MNSKDCQQDPGQKLRYFIEILLPNTKVNKIHLTVYFPSYHHTTQPSFINFSYNVKYFHPSDTLVLFKIPGSRKAVIHWVTSVSNSFQWYKIKAQQSEPDSLNLQTETIHFKTSLEDENTSTIRNIFKCQSLFISPEIVLNMEVYTVNSILSLLYSMTKEFA